MLVCGAIAVKAQREQNNASTGTTRTGTTSLTVGSTRTGNSSSPKRNTPCSQPQDNTLWIKEGDMKLNFFAVCIT